MDIDWGPIGQDRDGFINIPKSKYKSIKFKCDAKSTILPSNENYYWLRNGGYMGVNTQVRNICKMKKGLLAAFYSRKLYLQAKKI